MAEAVKVLPPEIQAYLKVSEWNVKTRAGITRKKELGALVIPCIALNHEMVFTSGIPTREELIAAIEKRLNVP